MRKPVLLLILVPLTVWLGTSSWASESRSTHPFDALTEKELLEQAQLRFFPLPLEAPNPENPITAAKVELGKILYFDTRLSKDGNVSCNSCHALATFGVDNLPLSPGDSGELGGRNSPTVLNAALHLAQFWDGRARDVEEQAGMPILEPDEMAIPSEEFLVERLAGFADYRALFAEAFPEEAEPLSYRNIEKALAAFERTLLTPSRFDDYLRGDAQALTGDEQEGLRTFMAFGCSACHNGYTVGGYSFRKFGLHGEYWVHTQSASIDEGRFLATGDEADRYLFKVAALRNVAETAPYFHDGSVATLEEALRVMGKAQLGRELSSEEAEAMAAFLRTLTGELPREVVEAPASP
jgi:cytochrome c peroxidase